MALHPTAVIAPRAEISSSADIGPYAVIGAHVTIGDNASIGAHCVIDGWTTIGKGCTIFPSAVIGTISQDLKYKGEKTYVLIGDGTTIREFVTVNGATGDETSTTVGKNCHIMAYAHIAHNCHVGDGVIMANGCTLAGCVEVHDKAVMGGLTGVHQFCRVGTGAIVGGCTKLVQDVIPFMLVDGNPPKTYSINTIGMERSGFSEESIAAVKSAHKILFRKKRAMSTCLKDLEDKVSDTPEIRKIREFIASSQRGITR